MSQSFKVKRKKMEIFFNEKGHLEQGCLDFIPFS
jgi:hypothetical protein